MNRRSLLLLVIVVVLPVLGPLSISVGQEEPGVTEAMADAHTLVKKRKWKDALAAYAALFTAHFGDEQILDRIRDIESDLKLAHFMKDFEPKENDLLFGPELVKFSRTSLSITLKCRGDPKGPNWIALTNEWFLNLRFANRLTVEFETATKGNNEPFIFYFCFDAQDRLGYAVLPGTRLGSRTYGRGIIRIDSGKPAPLEGAREIGPDPGKYKVIRDSASIRLYEGRKMVLKAKDKTYTSGMLGFAAVFPSKAKITGKLDRDFYQEKRGRLRDSLYRVWEKEVWSRELYLPSWALGETAVAKAPKATGSAGGKDEV